MRKVEAAMAVTVGVVLIGASIVSTAGLLWLPGSIMVVMGAARAGVTV